MKTAWEYIRISDEDQSNFSISGQQELHNRYCGKHSITIEKTFIDDGYSAKDFNRPEWQKLEQALSKSKNRPDYLVITKYDRLIRNAAEGLAFIERLEQRWKVTLLSVTENYFIDPHDPYFFKMRAERLVDAEFERRRISDRSKFGVWSAKTQGRFIGVAPLGYSNARDEKDKPIILINPNESPTIEQVYRDFLDDIPFPMIKHKMMQRGFHLKGHDALYRILSNHVYAGLIVAPAYKDETSKIKKGLHQPIISEDIFWKAYYKLQDQIRPQGPKIIDDNVPLRGFILCQGCGGLHTGGKSKGRSAYYYYYRCKKCRQENYSSVKVHDEITTILKYLSLEGNYIKALRIEAEIRLSEVLKERHQRLIRVTAEYEAVNENLDALEEKYITNKIAQGTYDKWYPLYSKELNSKKIELSDLKKDESKTMDLYATTLPSLEDLSWIYDKADVEGKQSFLKGIFWGGFTKEKIGGRTALLNPMFYENSLKIGRLLRVEKKGKPENLSSFPMCTRDRT